MIYVFVGTPEMVKAGKPFVVADYRHKVLWDEQPVFRVALPKGLTVFKTSKRGKTFKCKNGDTYHVHAWAELS